MWLFVFFDVIVLDSLSPVEKCKTKYPEVNPEENDTHPLLYYANKHTTKSSSAAKNYNKKGFGAGGLPPLFFSHGSRNWNRRINHYSTFGDEATSTSSSVAPSKSSTNLPSSSSSLPGVDLTDLPHTDVVDWYSSSDEEEINRETVNLEPMEAEDQSNRTFGARGGFVGGRDVEGDRSEQGSPVAKRQKLTTKGTHVNVPSSQVKMNDGGRGKERVRMKKGELKQLEFHKCLFFWGEVTFPPFGDDP